MDVIRRLFRHLQQWRSGVEAGEVDEVLATPDGREWVLWDLEVLYDHRRRLPEKMRLSIELFLHDNRLEREAAVLMGVQATNPVATYATVGITRLIALARAGCLPGCRRRFTFEVDREVA